MTLNTQLAELEPRVRVIEGNPQRDPSMSNTRLLAELEPRVKYIEDNPTNPIDPPPPPPNPIIVNCDFIVIGGAGTGGNGGPGGGQVRTGTVTLYGDTGPFVATVGGIGGTSSFNGVSAGPGGNHQNGANQAGENGGNSGGNPGGTGTLWIWPGDVNGAQWYAAGGGGAGAGGAGGNGSNDALNAAYPGDGGPGVQWIDGKHYGAGGAGVKGAPNGEYAENGIGWGNFGGGTDGGVIVSYIYANPVFSGGNITQVGDRVYHSFNTTGYLGPR
jgi:hypothetical protein